MRRSLAIALLLLTAISTAHVALAQQPPAPPQAEQAAPGDALVEEGQSFSVTVQVQRSGQPAALEETVVFLRAARPKGPFEPTDPAPEQEWTGLTDAQGIARFEGIPADLATRGLRLHALVMDAQEAFKSAPAIPTAELRLSVPIFARTGDLATLRVGALRTFIEPWEDFLVFSQNWTLVVSGDRALDTSLLTGEAYAKGLPLELPVKAQGINVFGAGEHQVINSTVYWRGVLKPGEPVNLQLRFSVPAKQDTLIYEQRLDYPAQQVDVLVPLETPHKKVPRLNKLELAGIGFKSEARQEIPGLGRPLELLYAHPDNPNHELKAGESIQLRLRGLPFAPPRGPWIALALGLLGALAVLAFAALERRRQRQGGDTRARHALLMREREALFEALAELERDLARGAVSARDYELESLLLRERLALILKKLEPAIETAETV